MEQLQYYISKLSKPGKDQTMNMYPPVAQAADSKHPTRPEQAENYPETNIDRGEGSLGIESSGRDAYNIR